MPRQKAKALPRPEPEMWTVQGDIVQETEDAILLQVNGADYWLPKSQIEYEGQRDDTDVKVTLPDWLAEDKGLSDGEGVTADAPAASQETPETCTFCGVVLGEDDETNTLHLELTPAGEEAPFSIRIDRARIVGRQPDEDGRESVTLPRAYALELELVQPNSEPAAQDKHFLESETITVVQELTQAEKAAYADEMARLDDEIETLEDERDKENKAKKKQIDALEAAEKALLKEEVYSEELESQLQDADGEYNANWAVQAISDVARLVGVYEQCSETGDGIGAAVIEAVQGLLAEKQKAEAESVRLTKMVDWLANQLDCPPEFTNCAVDCAECRIEAARRAVAAGEGK